MSVSLGMDPGYIERVDGECDSIIIKTLVEAGWSQELLLQSLL